MTACVRVSSVPNDPDTLTKKKTVKWLRSNTSACSLELTNSNLGQGTDYPDVLKDSPISLQA
jgi:hypothetical protein